MEQFEVIQNAIGEQTSENNLSEENSFEMLKTQVYPILNEVILELIDHVVKSEEVHKH